MFWRSGEYREEKDKTKRSKSFSGDRFGKQLAQYVKIAMGMKDSQWSTMMDDIRNAYYELVESQDSSDSEDLSGDEEESGERPLNLSALMDLDEA